MTLLTKDQILNCEDLKTEIVNVPEWGGEVILKTMTGTERDEWEASNVTGKGKKIRADMANFRAKLLSKTIVDENGQLMFTAAEVTRLGQKSALAIHRCFEVAQRINGLSAEEEEDIEGN